MSEHYYTSKPNVAHDERIIEETFFNKKFKFKTDAGVFSKKQIDFGSALMINAISDFDIPDKSKILDLGCGYGPIGVTIASLVNEAEIIQVDINERAVDLAGQNAKINQHLINQKVSMRQIKSSGFTELRQESFDYILLNPPIRAGKELIYHLFEESFKHLEPNGELWIVIQKKQGAPSSQKKLETLFNQVEVVKKDKGYFVIRSIK